MEQFCCFLVSSIGLVLVGTTKSLALVLGNQISGVGCVKVIIAESSRSVLVLHIVPIFPFSVDDNLCIV